MAGAAPSRSTEHEAATLAKRAASSGVRPPARREARAPTKQSPAPVVSTTLVCKAGMASTPVAVTTTAPPCAQRRDHGACAAPAKHVAGGDDSLLRAGGFELHAGCLGKLDLVQHRDVDRLQQPRRMLGERRHVEHGPRAGRMGARKDLMCGRERRLELRHPHFVGAWFVLQHRGVEVHVGAGGDSDRVVALGNLDQRHTGGRPVDLGHARAVDIVVGQKTAQAVGEGVVADRADHCGGRAEAGRGDRLVEALAARQERDLGPQDRLAGCRPSRALHDDIHVEATADDDPAHRGELTSSSAAAAGSSRAGMPD